MKAYKVELLIVDHDKLGANEIRSVLENNHYPNHCMEPHIMDIQEKDIGEWTDEHPLNQLSTTIDEYKKLFK